MITFTHRRMRHAILMSTGVLLIGALPGLAQPATPSPAEALDGATVALYGEPCDRLPGEPLHVFGRLQHREVFQEENPIGPEAELVLEEGVPNLIDEDANGNDLLDAAEDFNDNGRLDEGLLGPGDPVPASALAVTNLEEIWILESQLEADEVTAPDEQRSVVVRSGDGREQVLACGVVPLQAEPQENDPPLLYVDLGPVVGGPFQAIRGYVRPLAVIDVSPATSSGVRVVVFETPMETAPVAP